MATMARRPDRWASLALLAVGALVSGCGRGLLGISSTENRDASLAEVDPNPVPAGKSVCFPDHPASCDQTCRDATQILWKNCAGCHGTPSTARGAPTWDFLLDPQKLVTETWTREGQPAIRFVLPGDPGHSAIYQRAVINKDMPPLYTDPTIASPARVSDSDGQILHDWIADCIGTPPPSQADAGVDAANSSEPRVVACPAVPPSGSCRIDRALCLYAAQTCVCANGSWECLPCPAQQPSIGSSCPGAAAANGQVPLYRCGYGNLNCSCTGGNNGPVWECGACPAAHPAGGAACGSAHFSCVYGDDTCDCSGSWSCAAPYCPSPIFGPPWLSCEGSGTYGCSYGEQLCGCDAIGFRTCTCPASVPTEGQTCAHTSDACVYGDHACTCSTSAQWQCPVICPTVHPTDGAACTSTLSCSYDAGLCYCDGSRWHCS